MPTMALSPKAQVRVQSVGREQQPILIIDDALAHYPAVRGTALVQHYRPIGPYYPGVRCPVSSGLADDLRQMLADHIVRTFGFAPPPVREGFWSLVTTPAERLAPIQSMPHFDQFEDSRLAVLLYCGQPSQGGTAFYRHRSTGFESVNEARYEAYIAALEADVQRTGLPPPAYIAGDTPLFEQTALIDSVPNRLIVYHGNTLHCGAIPPGAALPANPATGRLSLNLFLFGDGA